VNPLHGTQFTAEGDNLRSSLLFPGRKIINKVKDKIWGFATPVIALAGEDVDKEKVKHHITAQRVSIDMTKG
jgi:hypothetical protein